MLKKIGTYSNIHSFPSRELSSAFKVITVGASRFRNGGTTDDRLSASNYGPCVDIYAPGRNINLAAPSGTSNSNYLTSSGTSFATPAVAGKRKRKRCGFLQYQILVQSFKSISSTLPQYISSFLQRQRTSYSLRSTSAPSLVIP